MFSKSILPAKRRIDKGLNGVVGNFAVLCEKPLLESIGYEVTSRTSGVDALKTFQSQPDRFDLVITDNNMPHMCGNEVARCILKTRENMPIIFCSGTINEKVQEKFKNHSNILFLRKPVTLELLNENIRQLIG